MTKKLQHLFVLKHRISVYVPSTCDINKPVDNAEFVQHVAIQLSKFFGGATSTNAVGYWLSDSTGIVKENTTIVFAYASEKDLEDRIDDLVTLCQELKDTLTQEAIALEIDGQMYFI